MKLVDLLARLTLLGSLCAAASAAAHSVGVSRGEYRVSGVELNVELVFARPEIAASIAGLDADADGSVSGNELTRLRDLLDSAILSGLEVRSELAACPGTLQGAELTEEDGLAVSLVYRCAALPKEFLVRMPLLTTLSVGHRHLVAEVSRGAAVTQVVYEARPDFQLSAAQASVAEPSVGGSFFLLGIEHILTGYDHLVFLLGLILVGGSLRSLLVVVTAFTVAHSATLGLATVGVWAPSASLIEPAIALSIAYVGVENWFVRDASRRWLLTFPFGLIHGFGFAGALREVALPPDQIPMALLSFNVGVEAGQVMVLALVLPLLIWLRKRPWFAQYGVRTASTLIAVAGLAWFVERVAF